MTIEEMADLDRRVRDAERVWQTADYNAAAAGWRKSPDAARLQTEAEELWKVYRELVAQQEAA